MFEMRIVILSKLVLRRNRENWKSYITVCALMSKSMLGKKMHSGCTAVVTVMHNSTNICISVNLFIKENGFTSFLYRD